MNNKIEFKQCAKCMKVLQVQQFNVCNANKDGLQSYCRDCQSSYKYRESWYKDNKEQVIAYNKARLEEQKGNYIYMFIPTIEEYKGEVLNIGSTIYLEKRLGEHRRLETKASKVIKESSRDFNIIYAEIKEDLTRDELYFIEYYLIHKYFTMQGVKPIGNDMDTYKTNICTSRQFALILIAEQLIFKKYDLFKYEKKSFYKCV